MKRIQTTALLILALAVLPAMGQDYDRLSIRVVTAGHGEQADVPDLKDVLPLLKSTLAFSSFSLDGTSVIKIEEGATASLSKGYDLKLSGVQDTSMTVTVTQGRRKKKLLETRLKLRPKRPVIVGGFDDPEGTKTILILQLR